MWCPENSLVGVHTDLAEMGFWCTGKLVTSPREHLSVPPRFSGPQGLSYHEEGPAVLSCLWGSHLCLTQQEGCIARRGAGCPMPSRAHLSLSIRTLAHAILGFEMCSLPGRAHDPGAKTYTLAFGLLGCDGQLWAQRLPGFRPFTAWGFEGVVPVGGRKCVLSEAS